MLNRGASLDAGGGSESLRAIRTAPRKFVYDRVTEEWAVAGAAGAPAQVQAEAKPLREPRPLTPVPPVEPVAPVTTPPTPAPIAAPMPALLAPPPAAPVPAPSVAEVAPYFAAAAAVRWDSPASASGVAWPGVGSQFQVLAVGVPATVEAPERGPRWNQLLHLDVILPLVAALIVLLIWLAWAP